MSDDSYDENEYMHDDEEEEEEDIEMDYESDGDGEINGFSCGKAQALTPFN